MLSMSGLYTLVYNELAYRLKDWLSPPPVASQEVETEPLTESYPYFVDQLRMKYAVWLIEGAYLRYKRRNMSSKELFKLWQQYFREAEQKYTGKYVHINK